MSAVLVHTSFTSPLPFSSMSVCTLMASPMRRGARPLALLP